MTEITNERDLKEFFGQKHAILFFHAAWSQNAVISKQMIEFVESYAKMGQRDVSFFFGEFEGERLPLAEILVAAGVPATVAFTGDGRPFVLPTWPAHPYHEVRYRRGDICNMEAH
jgi:hypothetical protein